MNVTLDTSTFLFDAKRDYLPDYKRHTITIDDALKVKDLLLEIKKREHFFDFRKTNTMLQVNGVSIKGSLEIKTAVELFGTDWVIEPISTFRAKKDLIIDDSDFYEKYALLEPFGDEEDFKYYKTLIRDYYASGTLAYDQDYYGDSMFIYAHYLIEKYPEKKAAILEAIDTPNGIGLYEKECNMYPYHDNAQKIYALLKELPSREQEEDVENLLANMAYYDKAEALLCEQFSVQKDKDCALETIIDNIGLERVSAAVKHPFSNFKVAFYAGDFACKDVAEVKSEARKVLETIGAMVVNFASDVKGDGFDIVATNQTIAFKKAATILFDAFDSGAEILVIDSKETHFMIDQCKKECEKAMGRDIRIPVLNISQMVALATGTTNREKLGLDAHKIAVEFI
jgi:hypothetical protein